MLVRLKDLPQLPKSAFRYTNGCRYLGEVTPCHLDTATGRLKVDDDCHVTGWCANPPSELMVGREGQILLMFFNRMIGDHWEHYPLFDQDERDAAVLECTLPPLIPKRQPTTTSREE